jgi:ligand-binding SRPBCC domain-containing protein
MIRFLHREQLIRAAPAQVWDFFATPRNLDELTPPDLRFRIVSDVPDRMAAGQIIEYRISPLPGVWLRWVTEITHVQEGLAFVDEQRAGPYKHWSHEHLFQPTPAGVLMVDRVTYDVGWGPLGWLAEKLWVRRQLDHIFDHRARQVDQRFNGA